MAITIPAALIASASDTDATSLTTGNFTPTEGGLIVACHGCRDGTTPPVPTVSDTDGRTWAVVPGTNGAHSSANRLVVVTSPASAGLGSTALTFDYGATTIDGFSTIIFEVLGCNTGSPIVTSSGITATGASTAPAAGTAPALADANNVQILVIEDQGAVSCAPASGWTEIGDVRGTAPAQGLRAYYRIGNYDSAPAATLSSSVNWKASAFEIAIAAGGIVVKASSNYHLAGMR